MNKITPYQSQSTPPPTQVCCKEGFVRFRSISDSEPRLQKQCTLHSVASLIQLYLGRHLEHMVAEQDFLKEALLCQLVSLEGIT